MTHEDYKELKKCIKEELSNGFMTKVTLAIKDALEPLTNRVSDNTTRIEVIENDERTCPYHQHHTEMIQAHETKLKSNNIDKYIMHFQWFAITILTGLVVYLLRNHL